MQRVLVTGASGFIGERLCSRLKAEGMEVTTLMRHGAEGPWDSAIRTDLSQKPLPADALKGIDTIFHLAGKAHALSETRQSESEYFNINTSGTRRLLGEQWPSRG